ncbi:hypothetical protein ACF0H5_020236 [Mactra antiquata]
MMSRYSDGHTEKYESYSPSDSPRGRRYILKNLNTKKLKQLNHLDTSRRNQDYYDDLRAAPSSQGSVNSNKHIGVSNKVMPTDSTSKTTTPRKTPRAPPLYVSPRKDVLEKSKLDKKQPESNSKSSHKTDNKNKDNKNSTVAISARNEKGLTPRDEYMVTKLYDKSREIIYLKPSEVRYTHDQVTAHFHDGRSMISTFIALLYGKVEIRLGGNDVPPIEVMQTDEIENGRDGKIWYVVNGNRRLYVFRRLERCGALTTMQVIARKYDAIEMDKHFLTRNHGRTISITNDATISAKFSKEVNRWKEWKAKQPKQKPAKGKKGKAGNQGGKGIPENKSSCCTIS